MTPKALQSCLSAFPLDRWESFSGQNYWITGGGTGYGRAMAIALSAANAVVYITGRRVGKLRETKAEIDASGISSDNCHCVVADITNPSHISAACQEIERHCSSLDGLVNNAALPNRPGSTSPLQQDSLEYWNKLMATNVTAPWLLTRTIFPHMIKSMHPRVLFISSGAGWAGTPGVGPYNVSKAALNSLSHSMALEYARDYSKSDIQINTLVAGEAYTEMNQGSSTSAHVINRMALLLLSYPVGGPNGCFFSWDGGHLDCGETKAYPRPLMKAKAGCEEQPTSCPSVQQEGPCAMVDR